MKQADLAVTAADYKALFEDNVRGAQVLEDLVRRFSKPAVTTGGIDAVIKTFTNCGENNVVQFIVRQINQANNVGVDDEDSQLD